MLIKSKRLSMGLTQEELAREMGVQRTAVAMWETGKAYPRVDVLIKLAKLFGCTVDELLSDRTEERELDDSKVNNIQSMRIKANITQEKLSELLGIDRSTIAKWETGVALPRAELLPKVAQTLNCTVDELLSDGAAEA